MKKRVLMAVATTTLASLVDTHPAKAASVISVPTEVTDFTAQTASGTPVLVPLGDNFADINASFELRLRTDTSSTGTNTIFLPNDIPTTQNGDIVGLESIIDVYLVLEATDLDPLVDFDVDLPRLPGDPNTVVFDFTEPFYFDIPGAAVVDSTADLSGPNLSTTSNVSSRTLFPSIQLNIGDITGDGNNNFADIFGLLTTTSVSSSTLPSGRAQTIMTASGTMTMDINPTFSFNIAGTFTVAEDIVIPASAVPVPAALWLFGSGLLGLIGTARRKKAVCRAQH